MHYLPCLYSTIACEQLLDNISFIVFVRLNLLKNFKLYQELYSNSGSSFL
jgi:hypothetical protein